VPRFPYCLTRENTLFRSTPCPECGADMLWTQNAWKAGEGGQAAYQCPNAHVVDPVMTRQCPACGIHDTALLEDRDGQQQFRCLRCGEGFVFPR
jgi:predicted RNA-binding Zn-ribbon protein involved in translation (DUF1610 family)